MSAPDHGPNDQLSAFPTPASGAGSADLQTDSNDPQELKALLERARERLSFYESFDKIIAENLRRTGEMMAETVALREQAAREAEQRQAADEAMAADRERHRALLEGALAEARQAQPVIDAMVARLRDALDEISTPTHLAPTQPPEVPDAAAVVAEPEAQRLTPDVPDVATPEQPETPLAEEPPVETQTREEAPEAAAPVVDAPTETPTTIEILAHGVPSATTAIGLQQMLREIDVISRVDAREFADGELRLHVECTGLIPDEMFTEWLAHNSGSLVSRNAKAIELSFS